MNVSMQATRGTSAGSWRRYSAAAIGPELLHTTPASGSRPLQELIDFDREFARMFSAPPKETSDIEGDVACSRGASPSLRPAGPAPPRRRDPVHPIDDHRRNGPPGSGQGFPGRDAHSPWSSGWPMPSPSTWATSRGPMGPGVSTSSPTAPTRPARTPGPGSCATSTPRLSRRSPGSYAARCGRRRRDRRPRRFPAGTPRPGRQLDVGCQLLPRKGRSRAIDYEKAFCPDPAAGDVFDLRGIDRVAGCLVVVRPDQYVAHVLPLDATGELAGFFARILIDAAGRDAADAG